MDATRIEALTHRCAACGDAMHTGEVVTTAYLQAHLRSFERQVELGILGGNVRNLWVHLDCTRRNILNWRMTPDIHNCIRCGNPIQARDMLQPVFQVVDARAVNPQDATDVGIALNERIYFVHCDCTNPTLSRQRLNLLVQP